MSVSIIIPCYNNAAFVGEAIKSALSQTVPDIEVIVIDDGSTDGSADVIRAFPEVTFISQLNSGVSTARNNGAKAATGSFLVFLDADDRLAPVAIQAHLRAFAENEQRVFVFGVCDIIDEQGRILKSHRQNAGICDYWDILLGITPNPSQCMLRRTEFDRAGGFDASLAYGEDWECFLRVSRTGESYCHGLVVADYRKHGTQSTRNPSKLLSNMLDILDDHCRKFARSKEEKHKFQEARVHYTRLFGKWIPGEVVRHLQNGRYSSAFRGLSVFLRNLPDSIYGFYGFVREYRLRASTPGK